MPRPFDIFIGEDGRWYQAGIDGEVFELVSKQTYSATDVLASKALGGVGAPARRLILRVGEKSLFRFIPSVLDELSRYRVGTHWWHGLPILCPAKTHADLIPRTDGYCPLCELSAWMRDSSFRASWLEGLPHEAWMSERASSLEAKISWEIPVLRMGYFDQAWKYLPESQWMRPVLFRMTPGIFGKILEVWDENQRAFSYVEGYDWVLERAASYTITPGEPGSLVPRMKTRLEELERTARLVLHVLRPPLVSPPTQEELVAMVETILQVRNQQPNDNVDDLLRLFPQDVVLVPQVFGTKRAKIAGWPDLTTEAMSDWGHRNALARANKALLTGRASGNICTVDVDSDEGIAEFVAVNPWAKEAMFSHARRGGNFYFQLSGKYPHEVIRLFDYRRSRKGEAWGEFRSGALTTLDGVHPKGMAYQIKNPGNISLIKFGDIAYPKGVRKVIPTGGYEGGTNDLFDRADDGCCLIDTQRLKGLRYRGRFVEAQCPACCEDEGLDKSMNHLVIYPNGKFGCCLDQSKEHYSRILSLVGIESVRQRLSHADDSHQGETNYATTRN